MKTSKPLKSKKSAAAATCKRPVESEKMKRLKAARSRKVILEQMKRRKAEEKQRAKLLKEQQARVLLEVSS